MMHTVVTTYASQAIFLPAARARFATDVFRSEIDFLREGERDYSMSARSMVSGSSLNPPRMMAPSARPR
jgi:hypothetical protein